MGGTPKPPSLLTKVISHRTLYSLSSTKTPNDYILLVKFKPETTAVNRKLPVLLTGLLIPM